MRKKLQVPSSVTTEFVRRVGEIANRLRSIAGRKEQILVEPKPGQRPTLSDYTSNSYFEIAVERQTGWSSTIFLVPSRDDSGATSYWYAFSVMLSAENDLQREYRKPLFDALMSRLHPRRKLPMIEVCPGHLDSTHDVAAHSGQFVQEVAYNSSRKQWFELFESVYLPFNTSKAELLRFAERFYGNRWQTIAGQVEAWSAGRGSPSARKAFVRWSKRGRNLVKAKHGSLQGSFRAWYAKNNRHKFRLQDIQMDTGSRKRWSADAVIYDGRKVPVAVVEVKPTRGELRTAIGQVIEYGAGLQASSGEPISRFIVAIGEPLGLKECRAVERLRQISKGRADWEVYGLDANGSWVLEHL